MSVFDGLSSKVVGLAEQVPLEAFVFFGSVIEEIIAPIPSPIVLTTAGALAHTQNRTWVAMGLIIILAALGKTLGAWFVYWVSDKLEDALIPRFGKYLGVTHAQIESLGAKLGKGWKDEAFLLLARALPIIPSVPISVACGLIRLKLQTYLWTTFVGTVIRNSLFFAVGYLGSTQATTLLNGTQAVESIVQMLILLGCLAFIAWAYWKRWQSKEKTPR